MGGTGRGGTGTQVSDVLEGVGVTNGLVKGVGLGPGGEVGGWVGVAVGVLVDVGAGVVGAKVGEEVSVAVGVGVGDVLQAASSTRPMMSQERRIIRCELLR